MSPPNSTANHNLSEDKSGDINLNDAASGSTDPNDQLLDTCTALWRALVKHMDATVDGFRLDAQLAASSLIALLVIRIVVAALLVGLWFLGMALLFAGLVTLQVSTLAALLVIVLIQLLLLFFCHRLSKRLLANLNFEATRAALPETQLCRATP